MSDIYTVTVEDVGSGYDPRHRLTITHNGKVLGTHYDYGESEDNSFIRDWDWVDAALAQAYKLGFEDGRKAALPEVQPDVGPDSGPLI